MEIIYLLILVGFVLVFYKYTSKSKHSIIVNPRYRIHQLSDKNQSQLSDLSDIYYHPQIIRKDTMNANPIETENLYFTGDHSEKPYRAWTTMDLSSTPSFYRSDFETDLLGMKNFHDKQNKYHSKPIKQNKPCMKKKMYPNQKCYVNSMGVPVCDFFNRNQETPYSLYNVNERGQSVEQPVVNDSVQTVNGEEYQSLHYIRDKPMNGGILYKNKRGGLVKASSQQNESPAPIS